MDFQYQNFGKHTYSSAAHAGRVHQQWSNHVLTSPIQRRTNTTGIPDKLKNGMEHLTGMPLDHVKVHYNSPEPAAVQAHAFAQGSDIHLGPGQENHLPHELGHVVQQAQGRVQPTTSVNGLAINDNPSLESEASQMGEVALTKTKPLQHVTSFLNTSILNPKYNLIQSSNVSNRTLSPPIQRAIESGKLNIVGELHRDDANEEHSESFRADDKKFFEEMGIAPYWNEYEFRKYGTEEMADPPYLSYLQVARRLYDRIMAATKYLGDISRFPFILDDDDEQDLQEEWGIMAEIQEIAEETKSAGQNLNFHEYSAEANEGNDKFKVPDADLTFIEELCLEWISVQENSKISAKETDRLTLGIGKRLKNSSFQVLVTVNKIGTFDEIRMQRSEAMLMAAMLSGQKEVTGVWKIGKDHIDDIRQILKEKKLTSLFENSNLTLTSYEDFNKYKKLRGKGAFPKEEVKEEVKNE